MQISKRQVWVSVPSHIPDRKPGFELRVRKDRTILTYKGRPELTMTAKSDGALHITLHRNKEAIERDAALRERLDNNSHHDLRTNDEGHRTGRIEFSTRYKGCNRPNRSLPAGRRLID